MTAPAFSEQSPHEKGFARVFAREIAPELERIEQSRRQHLRKFLTRAGITAGVVAGVIALVAMLPVSLEVVLKLLPTLVILIVVVGWIWARSPYKEYKAGLREVLVEPICRFLGDLEYTRKPNWGYGPLRFRELGVIPRYGRSELEDMFEGSHRDTGFRFAEARLIQGGGRYQVTVFDGLLFEIEVPVEFDCKVVVLPSRGRLGDMIAEAVRRWFPNRLAGYTRMRFAEPSFERRFRVYASDTDEAHSLMPTGFRAILLQLALEYRPAWWRSVLAPFRRRTLSAAFAHGKFFLALPTPDNLFEMGSMFRSTYACERDIRRFMREVVTARQVIDYLHGERPAEHG